MLILNFRLLFYDVFNYAECGLSDSFSPLLVNMNSGSFFIVFEINRM